jgi:TonB family protein
MPLKPAEPTWSTPIQKIPAPSDPIPAQNENKVVDPKPEKKLGNTQKTAALAILSGKGPGGRSGNKGSNYAISSLKDIDAQLGKLDGVTQFESQATLSGSELSGLTKGLNAGTEHLGDLRQGFKEAQTSSAKKIGDLKIERPKLLAGSARKAGGRNLDKVAAQINKNQSQVRLLYEEALKLTPNLKGKVTVLIVIEATGKVLEASVVPSETTLMNAEFVEELLRRIRRWVFPPFTGDPIEINSPFVFNPL